MTKITYITHQMPPLEMWVDRRGYETYLTQGFKLVDFQAAKGPVLGTSRVKIRKVTGPKTHTYSPELVKLHESVCKAWSDQTPRTSCARTRGAFHDAHNEYFSRYHREYIRPQEGETLEDVEDRVVREICSLVTQYGGSRGVLHTALLGVADQVSASIEKRRLSEGVTC